MSWMFKYNCSCYQSVKRHSAGRNSTSRELWVSERGHSKCRQVLAQRRGFTTQKALPFATLPWGTPYIYNNPCFFIGFNILITFSSSYWAALLYISEQLSSSWNVPIRIYFLRIFLNFCRTNSLIWYPKANIYQKSSRREIQHRPKATSLYSI